MELPAARVNDCEGCAKYSILFIYYGYFRGVVDSYLWRLVLVHPVGADHYVMT